MLFTCNYCGKQFEDKYRQRRWCSRACYWAGEKGTSRKQRSDTGIRRAEYIIETCFTCGKPFERRLSDIRNSGFAFCSRECYNNGGASQVSRVAKNKIGRPSHCNFQPAIRPDAPSEILAASERYGEPTGWTIDNGYCWYTWRAHPALANKVRTTRIAEHRVVAYEHVGANIEGKHVDHINGNRLDNRWTNLRVLSPNEHSKRTAADQGPGSFLAWAKENKPGLVEEWKTQNKVGSP